GCMTPTLLFQAEDGIRGFHVTGVQTCALPISVEHDLLDEPADDPDRWVVVDRKAAGPPLAYDLGPTYLLLQPRADLLTPIMATALELTGTQLARRIRRR